MNSILRKVVFVVSIAYISLVGVLQAEEIQEKGSTENKVAEVREVKSEDITQQETLTGDWGGVRTDLHNKGIDFGFTETLETLANFTGGTRRGAIIEGLLDMSFDVDFEKLAGIDGLTIHANAFQIHGRGLSGANVYNNILTASSIEAERSTRLFNLWVQKNFFDDNLSIRAGQIAVDDEFDISQYALLYINSAFGWPSTVGTNLPAGGPAFPLATPGVRMKVGQTEPWSFQMGVYDGDPSGRGSHSNPQIRNNSGTTFNLDQGALIIGELAYGLKPKNPEGLAGTYKLGGWYHTEDFADLRYDTEGLSLADPGSSGNPRQQHGNYGIYGVIDQMVWHKPGSECSCDGVGAFARFSWNPEDRNLVAYQVDAGVNWKALIPGRDDDTLGVAFVYAGMSDEARGLDKDTNAFSGGGTPLRDYEALVEVTYQAAITPWCMLQPDFQYIFHPGGNIINPDASNGATLKDAVVLGLRLVVKF